MTTTTQREALVAALREPLKESAHDMALSVLYHLETMYPAVWKAMSGSCRRSLKNTIESTFRVHAEEVAMAELQKRLVGSL